MKRLLALLLVLVLCLSASGLSVADESPAVYSYDFDLRFHMNADVFPARERNHMQGYADLMNMLELKGNITYCPSTKSFDMNADIIPVTNPEAAISFRLYGTKEYVGLTSPLLGNETICFLNLVMMEFAFKTWSNLHFPLQYLALLYPYVTESAFEGMVSDWTRRFGSICESTDFSPEELSALSADWTSTIHDDSRLKWWVYSLSLPIKNGNVMETELFHAPDFLLKFADGGGLKVIVDDRSETWTNDHGVVLFSRISENGLTEWSLFPGAESSVTETDNGYLPRIHVRSVTENGLRSFSAEGSYNLSESSSSNRLSLPESLFSVSLDMNNWPAVWPVNTSFDASLKIGGIIYPNITVSIRGNSTAGGDLSLTLSEPVEENGTEMEVFSCSGTIIPVSTSLVPDYSFDDFRSTLAVFNVNDDLMNDFVRRIRRPLFFGILNFLNELPARACQSVMDDLENYGVLDMVLID